MAEAQFFKDAIWMNFYCILLILSVGYLWPSKNVLNYYISSSVSRSLKIISMTVVYVQPFYIFDLVKFVLFYLVFNIIYSFWSLIMGIWSSFEETTKSQSFKPTEKQKIPQSLVRDSFVAVRNRPLKGSQSNIFKTVSSSAEILKEPQQVGSAAQNTPARPSIDQNKELSRWTKSLFADMAATPLKSQSERKEEQTTSISTKETDQVSFAQDKKGSPVKVKQVEVVPRALLNPEETLKELGLDANMEQLTENLRVWLSKMILKPLLEDVEKVTTAFAKAGLDHLNPYHPASFGMTMAQQSFSGQSILKNMITVTPVSGSQPQSLMDLAQTHKDDANVQKRLTIERYLSFASLAARRTHVISRIKALAKDNYMAAFNPADGIDSDTCILLCLFCTFMDENLPSSDFFDNSPFSSKYFTPMGEAPSSKPDTIQLVHVATQTFQLVVGKHIFTSYSGPNSLFHAIIFMVEYVHCHRGGFLGIGNLGSRAINLTSIFEKNIF